MERLIDVAVRHPQGAVETPGIRIGGGSVSAAHNGPTSSNLVVAAVRRARRTAECSQVHYLVLVVFCLVFLCDVGLRDQRDGRCQRGEQSQSDDASPNFGFHFLLLFLLLCLSRCRTCEMVAWIIPGTAYPNNANRVKGRSFRDH